MVTQMQIQNNFAKMPGKTVVQIQCRGAEWDPLSLWVSFAALPGEEDKMFFFSTLNKLITQWNNQT